MSRYQHCFRGGVGQPFKFEGLHDDGSSTVRFALCLLVRKQPPLTVWASCSYNEDLLELSRVGTLLCLQGGCGIVRDFLSNSACSSLSMQHVQSYVAPNSFLKFRVLAEDEKAGLPQR